jgi:hypothetical protein
MDCVSPFLLFHESHFFLPFRSRSPGLAAGRQDTTSAAASCGGSYACDRDNAAAYACVRTSGVITKLCLLEKRIELQHLVVVWTRGV